MNANTDTCESSKFNQIHTLFIEKKKNNNKDSPTRESRNNQNIGRIANHFLIG